MGFPNPCMQAHLQSSQASPIMNQISHGPKNMSMGQAVNGGVGYNHGQRTLSYAFNSQQPTMSSKAKQVTLPPNRKKMDQSYSIQMQANYTD